MKESAFFGLGVEFARSSRKPVEFVTKRVREGALIDCESSRSGLAPVKLFGMRDAFGAKFFAKGCI